MTSGAPSRPESGLRFALRALGHRNYRLFFAGQSVSLVGTWLTRVATSWLVYRLTGSAAMLGIIGFCGLAPTLLSPLAGGIIDRVSRHRVLLVTQVLSMLQSFALAALALSHSVTVLQIALLQLFQGAVNAFDAPARQAFVVEMVEEPGDLPNAIALNSSMFNGARLVGPSLAGVLIAAVGEGGCFLLDGVSYLAVIASLLAMRVAPAAARRPEGAGSLGEGFRYVAGSPSIRVLLALVGVVSLVGMPYTVLMPIMAARLGGGADTLGLLMAASGLGALGAALRLAGRRTVLGLGRVIAASAVAFGLSLVLFAASRSVVLALPLIAVAGFALMMQNAASNTVLQTIVSPALRGRVMAFYTMAVMGTAPLGSLAAGAIAARAGAPWTLAVGGAVCAVAGAVFATRLPALRALVRPVYRGLGILPEIAGALSDVERTRRTPLG